MKAQSSIEFSLIIGFFIFVFSLLMVIITNKGIETQTQKDYQVLKEMGDTLKYEVDFAGKTIEGYQRSIDLPLTINGLGYEINVTSGPAMKTNFSLITIHYLIPDSSDYVVFSYPNVTGNFTPGKTNNITRGKTLVCINKQTCP